MTAVMGAAKDTDITPLLEEMRWRREGAGTPYKVNQSEKEVLAGVRALTNPLGGGLTEGESPAGGGASLGANGRI